MSSIWKQFKNRETYYDLPGTPAHRPLKQLLDSIDRNGYTLFNCNATYAEGLHRRNHEKELPLGSLLAPVRPPYDKMWLQWDKIVDQQPFQSAALINRFDDKIRICAFASCNHEPAIFLTSCVFHLTDAGYPQYEFEFIGETDRSYIVLGKICTWVALFNLSLLNCKNIRLTNTAPSDKERKRKVNSHSEWKTLSISVPSFSSKSQDKKPEFVGLTRHHLVRGHFADYSNGPGMFGNELLRGVYWVCPHARGNADQGTIIKDYRLKPAKADSND